MKRYRPELWLGRTEDQVTLTYATSLALEMLPGLVRLDYDLGLQSAESLVVRRDLIDHASIQRLHQWLVHRCEWLTDRFADLNVVMDITS